jgi:hypothetical protein
LYEDHDNRSGGIVARFAGGVRSRPAAAEDELARGFGLERHAGFENTGVVR